MHQFLAFQLRRFPRFHRLIKTCLGAFLEWHGQTIEIIRRLPPPFSLGLTRGVYSDYDLLQAIPPMHEGRIVLIDQGDPPTPPGSMMIVAKKRQHTYQPWPIFWIRLKDVELIGPSLAHLNHRGYISCEATYGRSIHDPGVKQDPAYYYLTGSRSRARRLNGNWTSLVSAWMSIDRTWPYGHWLKDALPRLALLSEMPADTRILLPPVQLPYQVDSLKMLGVFDRCVWTAEKHLLVENYYFSTPPSMIAAYSPYVVEWLRKSFLPLVGPPDPAMPKRFYMRRRGDKRNIANEAEVLEFFLGIGWAIVDSASMKFEDQIRLFSQAEAICGPHGSGFSNLTWCKPGCKVLEIFCDQHMCAVAEWICHCLPPTQHRYLVFPADHRLNAIVDLGVLKKTLAAYGLI